MSLIILKYLTFNKVQDPCTQYFLFLYVFTPYAIFLKENLIHMFWTHLAMSSKFWFVKTILHPNSLLVYFKIFFYYVSFSSLLNGNIFFALLQEFELTYLFHYQFCNSGY